MKGEIKMTKKDKTTQETTFDPSSCMEMMAKMMGKSFEEMSCESIMTQCMSEAEIPVDWLGKMTQMAGSCCGSQKEPNSATQNA